MAMASNLLAMASNLEAIKLEGIVSVKCPKESRNQMIST